MFSLGYDLGSSSIKLSIINLERGDCAATGFYPVNEMPISSPHKGWAEQDPDEWWSNIKILTRKIISENNISPKLIKCIGISYQMHGLVVVDNKYKPLRPAIIWCDSRAVDIGENAFQQIGKEICLNNLLNSPGNFTASKLKWIKENEPEVYAKIFKIMLPGDYIAMKLTGEIYSTISGMTEGVFWDYNSKSISKNILDFYGFDHSLLPELLPTFSIQGKLSKSSAEELGLEQGTLVSYRAGDQPNNAFSLNVMNGGEIAATAGTSGVVYGVIDDVKFDPLSRVNVFAHVNYTQDKNRLGVLLCLNGTGILNSWVRKTFAHGSTYNEMNEIASRSAIGSDGITVLPFGNGAERILQNKNIGSHFLGIDFNRHSNANVFRAVQEGIAFSFKYGIEIMIEMGLDIKIIRAGKSNMFLSKIFSQTLSNITDSTIELYNTNGAEGAARGAAVGSGFYNSFDEAFKNITLVDTITPKIIEVDETMGAYKKWTESLNRFV